MTKGTALVAVLLVSMLALAEFPAGSAQVGPLPDVPQSPARDKPAGSRIATSRIRGRVLAADTGAPVRRAYIEIHAPELREMRAATTDADGRSEVMGRS